MSERSDTFSIRSLISAHLTKVLLTWLMTLAETALMALVPLFIGFAIDGLLEGQLVQFWQLAALMLVLIVTAVIRRIYDTRVYGSLRVVLGQSQLESGRDHAVSRTNAQLSMGRELVDFLEETLPQAIAAIVQFSIALIVLFTFSPTLAFACCISAFAIGVVYTLFHHRFYRLNAVLNHQAERQVKIIEQRHQGAIAHHLKRLYRFEVQISDTEAILYGVVFVVLLSLILFNLWFATTALHVTVGIIFAIVSYSWECVESALALPATLQYWSRLSEIEKRIGYNAASI